MRFKPTILIALLAGILAIGAFAPYDEVPYEERETLILHGVITFIKQAHVNPKPIDDDFSKEVFKTYLKRIDSGKRFLIQDEVDQLKIHELDIDDQTNRRTLEFFDISLEKFEAGVARAEVNI